MKLNNLKYIYFHRISDDCILSDDKFIKIYNFFLFNNYKIIENGNNSDVIILDLCGMNNQYIDKTIGLIEQYILQKKNIILIGCISGILTERYNEKLIYIKPKYYSDIEKYFEFTIDFNQISKISDLGLGFKQGQLLLDNKEKEDLLYFDNIENKIFIEISIGCEFNCSYCNIKKIKGNTKSIDIKEILDKIKASLVLGKKHVYLLSDDCGSYGVDIGTTFSNLLDNIFLLDTDIKIYIFNINPVYMVKFYEKIKKYIYSNQIVSILLPIQHTSKRILTLMKRGYNIEQILHIVDDIKKNSDVELHNHIIYDYHEETFEEFMNTLKFLKYYDKTVYLKYSDINNTYGDKLVSNNLKEKIMILKKLQKRYYIDITL